MCTLAVYVRCAPELPLVVAANRDEFYARPTAEPRVIADDPWVVAGQDLQAGGTWLGVNEYDMVVGLLNRRSSTGPDPNRRSRGLLCLEALQTRSPVAVVSRVSHELAGAYNGFNLLVADPRSAFVVTNHADQIVIHELPDGVHLLTNLDLNDPTCPRIAASSQAFARLTPLLATVDDSSLLDELRRILADHRTALDPRMEFESGTLCLHGDSYGTRSASVLAYRSTAQQTRFWHAAGPPCTTGFTEVATKGARDSKRLGSKH